MHFEEKNRKRGATTQVESVCRERERERGKGDRGNQEKKKKNEGRKREEEEGVVYVAEVRAEGD
jgi:hypothetical protein